MAMMALQWYTETDHKEGVFMPNYTVTEAATTCAKWWISYKNPNISEPDNKVIFPATRYNLLRMGFNASRVLIAVAAVAMFFFAFQAAAFFTGFGLLLGYMTEKAIHVISLPQNQQHENLPEDPGMMDIPRLIYREIRHHYNTISRRDLAVQLFQNCGVPYIEGWENREYIVFDISVWKQEMPVPQLRR